MMIPHWTLSAGPLNGIRYLDMSQLFRRNGLKTSWMSEECEMIPSNCRRASNQWWTLSLWLWRQLQVNRIHRRCSFFSSGEEQLSQTTVVCCGTLPNYSVSLWSGWWRASSQQTTHTLSTSSVFLTAADSWSLSGVTGSCWTPGDQGGSSHPAFLLHIISSLHLPSQKH